MAIPSPAVHTLPARKPLVIVGEAWGAEEEIQQHPFVGASGALLMKMLTMAGLMEFTPQDKANRNEYYKSKNGYFNRLIWEAHPEFHLTNCFNLRPPGGNDIDRLCGSKDFCIPGRPAIKAGKYIHQKYSAELERLDKEIVSLQPDLVVCTGNTPIWAATDSPGVRKMRGYPMWSDRWNCKVLGTYHPAGIMRQYTLFPVSIADFTKAKREMEFADLRRPNHEIWIQPTIEDLFEFEREHLAEYAHLSVDIETQSGQITCLGFAPNTGVALVVPFVDWEQEDGNYWRTVEEEVQAWAWVKRILETAPSAVGQNFLYDIRYLWKVYGIRVPGFAHDTMLLHHALQPEMEKGLNFLASLYTNEASWKFMRTHSKTLKQED